MGFIFTGSYRRYQPVWQLSGARPAVLLLVALPVAVTGCEAA